MTFLMRFGAVCGALCGLFIAVPGAIEAFTGETAATSVVLGVSPALAMPLLTALQLGQLRGSGRLGAVGYAVNQIGLGLFGGTAFTLNLAVFFLDEVSLAGATRAALLASAAVFAAGVVLFAIAMLRAGVYPRVPVLAYGIGFPVFAVAARLPDTPLTSALHVLVGASLIWLAAALRKRAGEQRLER
ncbi:hypothetical protein [Flindersiella endophytica]